MQIEINGSDLRNFKTGKLLNRLPGMNDIIDAAKHGKGRYQPYSEMKNYYQSILNRYFNKLPKFDTVAITIDWYEPNKRRDVDNITAGTKFLMDSLVKCEVIKDDSQKYVKAIHHNIFTDKNNPKIVINIEEVK